MGRLTDQLIRLHGIDAPELDQDVPVACQQIVCGTMFVVALKALRAGVKVRCEVVERDRLVAKVFSPKGVDISRRLVSAGVAVPTILDGSSRRRGPQHVMLMENAVPPNFHRFLTHLSSSAEDR